MEEQEEGAQVKRDESDAERGSDELPDPDREGPTPDQEREDQESHGDRSPPPEDLTDDPAYDPEGHVKGIEGG
jgi:hypothetical protein